MTKLAPIRLDDGTVIYMEVTENIETTPIRGDIAENDDEEEEESSVTRGMNPAQHQQQMLQSFQAIEGTIRAYTAHTLNAFRGVTIANVDKVTLRFGIEIGAEAQVPYITKGTAKSNLDITVECSFPKSGLKTPTKVNEQ